MRRLFESLVFSLALAVLHLRRCLDEVKKVEAASISLSPFPPCPSSARKTP